MIVKVQLALGGKGAGVALMIYNEDRTVDFVEDNEELLAQIKALPREQWAKSFWHAYMIGDGLHIDGQAPWQNW